MNSKQRRQWARKQGYTVERQTALIVEARLVGAITRPEKVKNLLERSTQHQRVKNLKALEGAIQVIRKVDNANS